MICPSTTYYTGEGPVKRPVSDVCSYCLGSGVVFALDDGLLVQAGETVINQNPRWVVCPKCNTVESRHVDV